MKVMNKQWKKCIEYLTSNLPIKPRDEIFDFIAVEEILYFCVSGLSNDTIKQKLNLSLNYIENVLLEFLKFSGWKKDLDISIWIIYLIATKNYTNYTLMFNLLSPQFNKQLYKQTFEVCKRYDKIYNEIEDYYE